MRVDLGSFTNRQRKKLGELERITMHITSMISHDSPAHQSQVLSDPWRWPPLRLVHWTEISYSHNSFRSEGSVCSLPNLLSVSIFGLCEFGRRNSGTSTGEFFLPKVSDGQVRRPARRKIQRLEREANDQSDNELKPPSDGLEIFVPRPFETRAGPKIWKALGSLCEAFSDGWGKRTRAVSSHINVLLTCLVR